MGFTLALGLARGLHVAGGFALFGTLLLEGFLLAPAEKRPAMRRLVAASLSLALLAGFAWFLLQSADMANAANFGQTLAALPLVAQSTRFGHLLLARCALLLVAYAFRFSGATRLAALPAGIAVIAQAWLDHGGAMSGNIGTLLLLSAIIHLAAGAAWIGSLPALFLAISAMPPRQAQALARRYSPLGITCVLALLASATVQFIYLIGGFKALLNNAYGEVALAKIFLLAGLITLAARNRYRLTPALASDTILARTRMLTAIGIEIALGVSALLAAGLLLNLTPPTMAAMLATQQ